MLLSTLVNGVNIELTPKSLGKILNIPYLGLALNDIEMNDDQVFSRVYLPGQSPMVNNKIQLISSLIGRILAFNICPKTSSYHHYSRDLATCVYAIMAKFEVNCARVMFDTLIMEPFTFPPYCAILIHVF